MSANNTFDMGCGIAYRFLYSVYISAIMMRVNWGEDGCETPGGKVHCCVLEVGMD